MSQYYVSMYLKAMQTKQLIRTLHAVIRPFKITIWLHGGDLCMIVHGMASGEHLFHVLDYFLIHTESLGSGAACALPLNCY